MRMAMTGILSKGVTYLKAPKGVIKSFFRNRTHIFTHKNRQYVWSQHISGFTLIEMLVVMAIILILATLVYAAVAKSIKRAEQVEDVSDTRQQNIIALTYANDYDSLPEHLKEGRFGDEK